jgi:hypothetical protein
MISFVAEFAQVTQTISGKYGSDTKVLGLWILIPLTSTFQGADFTVQWQFSPNQSDTGPRAVF